jgi:hypothetical protein
LESKLRKWVGLAQPRTDLSTKPSGLEFVDHAGQATGLARDHLENFAKQWTSLSAKPKSSCHVTDQSVKNCHVNLPGLDPR